MARIVVTALGSLGDLHPMLGAGAALAARGHAVTLATYPSYRERVEAAGLAFRPMRPDIGDFGDLDETFRKAMSRRSGSRFVLEHMVLGFLGESVEDLLAASEGCDLIVGHLVVMAAQIVADKLRVPRVHTVLQPLAFFPTIDPPIVPMLPASRWWQRRGPRTWRVLLALMRAASRPALRKVETIRAGLGLPPSPRHPLLEPWSVRMNLGLFSPLLAAPNPSWPKPSMATGFPFWRGGSEAALPARLAKFLDAGEPPVVFTLGSAAVYVARDFYLESAKAAAALGVRAVLLTGLEDRNPVPPELLSSSVITEEYAPFHAIFPRAAAIVHQGGIGTTAEAMASGRPSLVVPFSHDQPDNAARCGRLGIAVTLDRERYRADRVTRALGAVLADAAMAARAREAAERIARENGAEHAAEAIERALG